MGKLYPASPGPTHAHDLGELACRRDPNLPAWIVKAVGGSTTHWAGASLRFDEHEFKIKSVYGGMPGANLLDWPITLAEMEPYYAKAENKMGVTRPTAFRSARQQQFQGARSRRQKARLQDRAYRQHGDQWRASRRTRIAASRSVRFQGCKSGAEMVDALHRDS
jgi:choline dehydrogenase-like flavoprotein